MSKQISNLNKSLHQDYAKESTVTTKVNALKTEIMNDYVTPIIGEMGSLGNLQTTEKGNLVGAINELFQNVDSGKQLIADAIDDETITKDSTFSAMSEAIEKEKVSGKRSLYNELIAKGYEATESMSVEEMVALLEESDIDPNTIKQISSGKNSHTFILKNDGTVWATGYNFYGQLGLGDSTNRTKFTQVDIDNVKQIECGGCHTMVIKNDGSLWGCGYGDYGQLGLNSYSAMKKFTQVTINMNNDAKQVACGDTHTLLLKTDGTVWSCGSAYGGQIGLGVSDTQVMEFTKVSNISDAKQVECYGDVSFVLKNDGSLWACGENDFGQLGLGDSGSSNERTSFTQVTTNINNDVKQVFCGSYHTVILKNDGTIWTCGRNNYGQLGLGIDTTTYFAVTFTQVPQPSTSTRASVEIPSGDTGFNDVKQVSCGTYHTFALKNDGTLWSVGRNTYGQLGLGNTLSTSSFTQVATNINNIHLIECSGDSSFICNDESLYTCGDNGNNQLGGSESTTFTNRFPIDSIEEYALRLKLWQFLLGINLPVNSFMSIEEMLEVLINKGDHLEDVLHDVKSTLISLMREDGHYVNDDEDISSLIHLLKMSNISISDIKQIACGSYHTFILKNDGSIWSCGYNNRGQLGLGNNTNQKTFTRVTTNINNDVKQIACGGSHTVILKNDGSVWSCGYNTYGQLGLGNNNNNTTFTQVTTNINNDVKQIACGNQHTIILKNNGSLWACGYNSYGQLGLGSSTTKNAFTKVTTNINNDAKQAICGYNFTVIEKTDGTLWGCGDNSTGQLGLGDTTQRNTFAQVTTNASNVKQIACGNNHTIILKNDGTVWGCGYNAYGALGLGASDTSKTTFTQVINNAKQIACGGHYTVILKSDGSIWASGSTDYGQFGLGDTTERTAFTQITANINNNVKQIACGYGHTFILKNDGSIWSCGDNANGQLGFGDNTQRNTFTQVSRGF